LWYWSDVLHDDAELRRWASSVNAIAGLKLIDTALYRRVQAHYVAAPSFIGMQDPLPTRWGIRDGLDDSVTLIIPEPDPKNPELPSAHGYESGIGVQGYLAQIAGPRGFRESIKSAIASYIAIYGSAADPEPIKNAIRARLDEVDLGWRADPNGRRYEGDEHLDKMIVWVRQ
jgi:hypothetical protein